jgi:DNA-binding NarL/FixJ family response regulator
MDIRMPVLDGIEALRVISADAALKDVKVIVLTTFEIDDYIFDALQAGASGFVLKETEPVELLRAVRVVAAGESLLSPTVTRSVIARLVAGGPSRRPRAGMELLTEREREVVGLVAAGLSNDEIADRLTVSPATVRTHVSRALFKTGARDRAQLVVFAYQSGFTIPTI